MTGIESFGQLNNPNSYSVSAWTTRTRGATLQQNLQYQESVPNFAAQQAASTDATAPQESRPWCTAHPVNVRLTIPVPFVRCYLTVVGGKERRSPSRRRQQRQKHPIATTCNIAFLVVLGLITGLAFFAAIQLATHPLLEMSGVF